MKYSIYDFSPEIDPNAYIAPSAIIIGKVKIASGASIWFNSMLRGDINYIEVGKNTNIQDGCMLHVTHEDPVVVEDEVTVGHGVILHGCRVESGSLIAMGAVVLDGVKIESGCLIAAGAVLAPGTRVPKNSLVMGVPGKVVKELTPKDQERIRLNWQVYVAYAKDYREGLKLLSD
jgi:carbonic anhydrase/acetyltransferase-like protein (isoleucine patch superfamily)